MGLITGFFKDKIREEHKVDLEKMISTACKDGDISAGERSNIHSKGVSWYYTNDEIEGMLERELQSSRIRIMRRLISSACKDGEVSECETSVILSKGEAWSFSSDEIYMMIEEGITNHEERITNQRKKDDAIQAAKAVSNKVFSSVSSFANKLVNARTERVKLRHQVGKSDGFESAGKDEIKSKEEGMRELYRLIDAALCDNYISPQEKRTLSDKAFRLGISDDEFEILLNQRIAERQPSMPGPAQSQPLPPGAPIPSAKTYSIAVSGQTYGPFSVDQLRAMIPTGQFSTKTMVWTAGMNNWAEASSVPDLSVLFMPAPPPPIPGGSGMPPIPTP